MCELFVCFMTPMLLVVIANMIINNKLKLKVMSENHSYKILSMTTTNNDSSSFSEVFDNLDKLNIKLHCDMTGYLNNKGEEK